MRNVEGIYECRGRILKINPIYSQQNSLRSQKVTRAAHKNTRRSYLHYVTHNKSNRAMSYPSTKPASAHSN